MRRAALFAAAGLLGSVSMLGCGEPAVPADPTWANVQPILAGQCSGCHGASAAATGAGYRFDFYDMTTDVCGEAAQAIGADTPMAQALSPRIWEDVTTTTDQPGVRPKMPPEPAPYLAEWEWKTIRAWMDGGTRKGDLPPGNHPARFRLYRSASTADRSLDITALVEDPDGDPVVGVLKLGDVLLRMDRSGSFSAHLDTSTWPAGELTVSAVLCDGWSSVDYTVGTLTVSHAP